MKSNWTGFYTLFKREFLRFFQVPNNTIFPQLITVLFYFLIFGIAIGSRIQEVAGVPYFLFILPGLFVQVLINGSYSNPSGSLFTSRSWGNISDVLTAPISYTQFTLAYIFAAMLRGFFLGVGTLLIAWIFMPIQIYNIFILLAYVILISFVFSLAGVVIGLWSKTWEQLNIFINFIVTPLTFLGGVFYTLDMVPGLIATITRFNPIFYMISGVRYGMLGIKDGNVFIGLGILAVIAVVMFWWIFTLVKRGYNLRT